MLTCLFAAFSMITPGSVMPSGFSTIPEGTYQRKFIEVQEGKDQLRTVTVGSFQVANELVTFGEFFRFVDQLENHDGVFYSELEEHPYSRIENRYQLDKVGKEGDPAYNITWSAANEYARWLSKQDPEWEYRLILEPELEFTLMLQETKEGFEQVSGLVGGRAQWCQDEFVMEGPCLIEFWNSGEYPVLDVSVTPKHCIDEGRGILKGGQWMPDSKPFWLSSGHKKPGAFDRFGYNKTNRDGTRRIEAFPSGIRLVRYGEGDSRYPEIRVTQDLSGSP